MTRSVKRSRQDVEKTQERSTELDTNSLLAPELAGCPIPLFELDGSTQDAEDVGTNAVAKSKNSDDICYYLAIMKYRAAIYLRNKGQNSNVTRGA
jgi:hypothetical protein